MDINEKLKKANSNIDELIYKLVDMEVENLDNYCPYRMYNYEVKHDYCDEGKCAKCKYEWIENRKKTLSENYIVK